MASIKMTPAGLKVPNDITVPFITGAGHYVDHELVTNLESDTNYRIDRVKNGKAKRYLLTVGGAGAQQALFADIIKALLPDIP